MVILDSYRLELGEGPGYDPASGLAWWFDIPARRMCTHRIMATSSAGGTAGDTLIHALPMAASAMAITKSGRQLLLAEDGLYFRDAVSGALDLHVSLEPQNPATRSNDARVHPSGAFWISTMGWNAEPGAGSIYRYYSGKVERLWDGLTIPNAICFSPDGRSAYFCDTPERRILRVETDPASGSPLGPPQDFVTDLYWPDGAVTDAAGTLWVAIFGTGELLGFASDGRPVGRMMLPARNVTCPAFVGPGARQMLVTSGFYGLGAAEKDAAPQEGATFLLPLDFAGRFDPPVVTGEEA